MSYRCQGVDVGECSSLREFGYFFHGNAIFWCMFIRRETKFKSIALSALL